MKDYLANAIAYLYSQGLKLEHPAHNAAMPKVFLKTITNIYLEFDNHFSKGSEQEAKDLPKEVQTHFFQLQDTVRFEHGLGTYRLGAIDTGLRSEHHKPSGENIEALALIGMIVEKEASGANFGRYCTLTMLDETNILTSSKFFGTDLTIINVFYPETSTRGMSHYKASDINHSKLLLQNAHLKCGSGINEILTETGLLELAVFSFETLLKSIPKEKSTN